MSEISDKTKVSLLDNETEISERRNPKSNVNGLQVDWNDNSASEFQAEHMYMFYGEPIIITIRIDRERYTLLHDFFGDRYFFRKHIDDCWDEVVFKCVPKAMESWAMQCSYYVEVLSRESIRENIRNKCKELCRRYR